MRDLEDCRKEIDEIDAEIVKLFERRMNVSHDIALYKQAHYMDILNPAREDAVLRSRAHQAASPELAQSVMSLFGEIMRLSREEQRRYLEAQTETRLIAYSGVPGAYSESAVVGFFGEECERVNYKTFEEVFLAVADGKARYGVVPVENSSSGSVNDVYDLLGKYACHIVGEQLVRVEHCLLGIPGAKVEDIQTVFSHEQGFAQCPAFLGEHPDWVKTPYSTRLSPQSMSRRWGISTARQSRPDLQRSTTGWRFLRRIFTRSAAITPALSSSARRLRRLAFRIRRPSPLPCAMSAAR